VTATGVYDYTSTEKRAVKIPVKHPTWAMITDLGYKYIPDSGFEPVINHPDRKGRPDYFSVGYAAGNVSGYKVGVTEEEWEGFPDDCGLDAEGKTIFPLISGSGYWDAVGLDRIKAGDW